MSHTLECGPLDQCLGLAGGASPRVVRLSRVLARPEGWRTRCGVAPRVDRRTPQARKVDTDRRPTAGWQRAAQLLSSRRAPEGVATPVGAPPRGSSSLRATASGALPAAWPPRSTAGVVSSDRGSAGMAPVVASAAASGPAPALGQPDGGGLRRGARPWSERCFKCQAHVPQREPAAVCDVPGCTELLCLRCQPDLSQVVTCAAHATAVAQVHTAEGPKTIVAAVTPRQLPEHTPAAAVPWYMAVAVFLAAAPEGACTSMERAMRYFSEWVRFIGLAWEHVCPFTVCAYLIARCCPVVGRDVPAVFGRPVAPRTAASDITALRRRARLASDHAFLDVLCDETVMRMCSLLTANSKKKKSDKAPILLRHLRQLWEKHGSGAKASLGQLRNVTLLLVGLLAGLRRREIVALRISDVSWDPTKRELTITVRRDKTNGNIIAAQSPRSVVVAHELLDQVWPIYSARFRLAAQKDEAAPLFSQMTGCTINWRSLDPATVNTIVRESLPGLGVSPHSLRVGFATELAAAGVDIAVIMELGRWSSLAALHYVMPSADKMAAATRAIGGGLQVDRAVLQRSLGSDPVPPRARPGPRP